MKFNKSIIILIMAVLSGVSAISAQTIKRNAEGQKLIKRITSDLLQIDGTVHPGSYNDTYDLTYFPNGQLKSITFSCKDDDGVGRVAEKIFIDNDKFNIVYLNNGKVNPNQSGIIKSYRDRRNGATYPYIESIARKVSERDPRDGSIKRFCDIFYHDRYRSLKVDLEGWFDNMNELIEDGKENGPDFIVSHRCGRSSDEIFPRTSLSDIGFRSEICMFEDNDGHVYSHHQTTEKVRHEQEGNLMTTVAEPNTDSLGDIFTDYVNDTNLNLQFFYEVGMPELMTEWLPVRSKNLIKYEHATRPYKAIDYWKYWEYEFDSAGNLIGATVIRKGDVQQSKYHISIEYVYE